MERSRTKKATRRGDAPAVAMTAGPVGRGHRAASDATAPPSIHPDARKQHPDGSPVSVCRRCVHFRETDPILRKTGRGICEKHGHGNMWFGNCDDWWPSILSRPPHDSK